MEDEEEEEWRGIGVLAFFWLLLALVNPARSELATQDRCAHDTNGRTGSPNHIRFSLQHPIFETDILVSGIRYQAVVTPGPKVTDYSLWVRGECIFGTLDPVPLTKNFTVPERQPFVNFTLRYRLVDDNVPLVLPVNYEIAQVCNLTLRPLSSGNLSSSDLPGPCLLRMSSSLFNNRKGIVIRLVKLNVACSKGGLVLGDHGRICGKLQEIKEIDRVAHFPDGLSVILVEGVTVFEISWRCVDHCYNVTLTSRNGSLDLSPTSSLSCNYRLHLPYGYKASISLGVASLEQPEQLLSPVSSKKEECNGVELFIVDGSAQWSHCYPAPDTSGSTSQTSAYREMQLLSNGNSVTLRVQAKDGLVAYPSISIRYEAIGEESLIGGCSWPWVRYSVLCLLVVEGPKLPWRDAEEDCISKGGHLASIQSQEQQDLIDLMLLNSPSYRDENSYWVGATDDRVEGDFQWSDSLPFTYTNWFPGWHGGEVNQQPNDDGLSDQDCVELRRLYKLPGFSRASDLAETFMWNDRDCKHDNLYICERLVSGERMLTKEELKGAECNRTIILTSEDPRTTVTSPEFPRPYPDETVCLVKIETPLFFTILLEFEELVLEHEPTCSYDYVEVQSGNSSTRLCGDWSNKLKLLRQVLPGPSMTIKFLSDYSHNFGGFKARISIEQTWPECGDDRLQLYNNSCYLFVSFPDVSWHTAREICREMKADLASIHSSAEERFIVRKIRESREYTTSAVYWLGAKWTQETGNWAWDDGTSLDYNGWVSNENFEKKDMRCLGLQWTLSPAPLLPSSLYWSIQQCETPGGYVCKKDNQGSGLHLNLNKTINGSEGTLSSPQHPRPYLNNLDYWIEINSPQKTRIVVVLTFLDLEHQAKCLYDYLEVLDPRLSEDSTKLCGHYSLQQLKNLRIVSSGNIILVHFRSDYSISGEGFSLSWKAVDVSGCPLYTTTAQEGVLTSPNYPQFLLSRMDCSTTILAPVGKRVWLEITDYDAEEPILEVDLGGGEGRLQPFTMPGILSDGAYVSAGERIQITLRTGDNPMGRGYQAIYKTVGNAKEEHIVNLGNITFGRLLDMNYPSVPPRRIDLTHRLIAPIGHTIHLQFNPPNQITALDLKGLGKLEDCSQDNDVVEVIDAYSDSNGTAWRLCGDNIGSQISVETYLNTVSVRCKYGEKRSRRHNITVTIKPDPEFKTKLKKKNPTWVETCEPNPCQNGGKCKTNAEGKHYCTCTGHFTGFLCVVTLCELEPCLFGRCELNETSFKCYCKPGYHGEHCDTRHRPCSSNPCDNRGSCVETNDASFKCRCNAWWEGTRCERKRVNIPYKPLSERMLQEPFWLGLITVTVVLGCIGLFWCAKRHFPEKLEKLLAEENERGRPYMSTRHCPSVRERTLNASVSGLGVTTGGSGRTGDPLPRTLLGRLGIRKPSLLLVPTNHQLRPASSSSFHQGRTFSLDDLVTGATTPSPRKKRNNSTPTKKSSAFEKKQILQSLVSPANIGANADSIPLSNNTLTVEPSTSGNAETSFSVKLTPGLSLDHSLKLEKKVTFARLLDKVSSEMSSGSELEVTGGSHGALSALEIDAKSPNSTSSNQGSDSRSSSETHLSLGMDVVGGKKAGRKTASADSILAMFRNFTSVNNGIAPSSPTSTTPTGSSPRDEVAGSDDSSANTPTSSSSGIADSPMFSKKNTIQVTVFDPLNAQKSCNNLLQPPSILLEVPNKCLSPIRELPTPSPSPAITPVMPRHAMSFLSPTAYRNDMKLDLRTDLKETNSLVVPVVTVQEASPVQVVTPGMIFPGSPPPQPSKSHCRPLLKDVDKPNSLDLPCPPPIITVTCSMTEGESDADSPAIKSGPTGMCYLSPFSMCSRNDRTTSESNLSSSGYSSMASPGPSRCGSNNPLCPTDEEHHIPRRPSPLLRAPSEDADQHRGRSDSETMSDDPQLESNDEGFGTDQLEEKIEDGELKSAKELEVFMDDCDKVKLTSPSAVKHCSSFELLENCRTRNRVKHCSSVEAGLDKYRITPPPVRHTGSAEECLDSKRHSKTLQLPSILVDGEPHTEKNYSPVSSRSESPLSDKTGLGRFSPMFYGRFTDSDGLYDCISSDPSFKSRKHSSGRKRERRRSKSPTKISQVHLEVPGKGEPLKINVKSGKPSPKRRARLPHPITSSSSSSAESLNSIRDVTVCLSREKLADSLNSCADGHWSQDKERATEDSADDTEDVTSKMLPDNTEGGRGLKKISRMRAIGHQIRFLRRLEQSLKRNRERLSSPERPLLPQESVEKRLAWIKHCTAAGDHPEWTQVPVASTGRND
ncbi:uncharacterized protein LOC106663479 isoform X2 [Cimex lectularius]|uniref:Uncharacterized protein n=1 Tax=Cimex lectularius TaxID=79782 RepID=A0A8I6ST03_CIMLE|nr:uncharacterized protein LOC106663479 isoform X2 [Cimex lectularius]